jgi:hypothetical protein
MAEEIEGCRQKNLPSRAVKNFPSFFRGTVKANLMKVARRSASSSSATTTSEGRKMYTGLSEDT